MEPEALVTKGKPSTKRPVFEMYIGIADKKREVVTGDFIPSQSILERAYLPEELRVSADNSKMIARPGDIGLDILLYPHVKLILVGGNDITGYRHIGTYSVQSMIKPVGGEKIKSEYDRFLLNLEFIKKQIVEKCSELRYNPPNVMIVSPSSTISRDDDAVKHIGGAVNWGVQELRKLADKFFVEEN